MGDQAADCMKSVRLVEGSGGVSVSLGLPITARRGCVTA